jgi:hypothetical protein
MMQRYHFTVINSVALCVSSVFLCVTKRIKNLHNLSRFGGRVAQRRHRVTQRYFYQITLSHQYIPITFIVLAPPTWGRVPIAIGRGEAYPEARKVCTSSLEKLIYFYNI